MDIGSRLKSAREQKSMSLEEVQQTTKIQKRYLTAIENNEFQVLPGKFYTRAFIREYASAVGLDPEQIMEEHKNELPSYEDEEIVQYSRVQKSRQQTQTKKTGGGFRLFPGILTVLVVLAIGFAIYMLAIQGGGSADNSDPASQEGTNNDISVPEETEEDQPEEENNEEEQPSEEQPSEEPEPAPEPEQPEEEPEQPEITIELTQQGTGSFPEHTYTITGVDQRTASIELSGDAYLDIQAPKGGESLIQPGIITAEQSPLTLDFSGQNQLYVKTGSAPNTSVVINGKAVPFPNPEQSTQKLLLNFE
ncbi:helix-turn-helix domain-containing protein [Halobacillus locisalis]|uniref:Helix-turn-helix domain-containing protein n=2 Tax=Halobacillus locisalis TaxID=220753 RepID=A0A838CQ08_9BACI|nr:helix-turn-helix domain-containing protein [Halobacillus locisalis]